MSSAYDLSEEWATCVSEAARGPLTQEDWLHRAEKNEILLVLLPKDKVGRRHPPKYYAFGDKIRVRQRHSRAAARNVVQA